MLAFLAAFLGIFGGVWFFVGHIAGGFPQPLSSEEEGKYLHLAAEGDDEARKLLIQHNLRLVAHIAKKFTNRPMLRRHQLCREPDDLISIGTIGLIKAIQTYDVEKGTKLATYAARCIQNEILMAFRTARRRPDDLSLQDPIGTDKEGNEVSLMDILGTDADHVPKEVDRQMEAGQVLAAVNTLHGRERLVVKMRYGLTPGGPYTQRDVAQCLNISRSYVSRIEKKALHVLKDILGDEGLDGRA